MSDDELNPCPFCGHTDIEHFYNRSGIDHSTCQYCGATAIDWNTRVESDGLPEWMKAKLKEAYSEAVEECNERTKKAVAAKVEVNNEYFIGYMACIRWILSLRRGDEK